MPDYPDRERKCRDLAERRASLAEKQRRLAQEERELVDLEREVAFLDLTDDSDRKTLVAMGFDGEGADMALSASDMAPGPQRIAAAVSILAQNPPRAAEA